MTKVQKDRYGSRTPKLTPEDLDGGDFIVLTVSAFDEQTIEDEEGKRVTPLLMFKETADKVLYLNTTQVGYLIEQYGDESDEWVGKPVPVENHTSTFRGKQFEKLWVMPPERWSQAFEEAGVSVKKAPRPRRMAAAKLTGPRSKVAKRSRDK